MSTVIKLKIAFFGKNGSFDFYHIGGTDSIIRRLSFYLTELGDEVGFIHYGCKNNNELTPHQGIKILKFKLLNDAMEHLNRYYDHVISIYIAPIDRLSYAAFRRANAQLKYHHLYQNWSEYSLKRKLNFAEAQIFPFNGCLFCVSPRIRNHISQRSKKAVLLYPPVPEKYFIKPADKSNHNKIKVRYLGRVDTGKGTYEAAEVFRRLSNLQEIETGIFGFPWAHNKETMLLHKQLLTDPRINYQPVEYGSWSQDIESYLSSILRETDILLLPYRKLSSTVDMPLLLLEGMAHLCAVIMPDYGDLHQIYGESPFNLTGKWANDKVVDIIINAQSCLQAERERLYQRCQNLSFDSVSVTNLFKESLATDSRN